VHCSVDSNAPFTRRWRTRDMAFGLPCCERRRNEPQFRNDSHRCAGAMNQIQEGFTTAPHLLWLSDVRRVPEK
jgi:hypothetical protein